jgi:hypothetical protein
MATLTVSDAKKNAATLSAMASALLTGLADGEYDDEIAFTENLLIEIGAVLPVVAEIEKAGEFLLLVNKMTAPRGAIVPDGRGGFVPATNSRFDPATGGFL